MAVKKKSEKQVVATQLITVDAGKLSQGLKATFEGVAMVFDSIGVPVDISNPADFGVNVEEATVDKVENVEKVEKPDPVAETQEVPVAAEKEAEAKVEPTPVKEEVAEEPKAEPKAPVENKTTPSTPAVSVTVDDITKVIVQKIKQNRKNNEKIGAILKTYGASKVGELPVDKYEAFLTDLSAI